MSSEASPWVTELGTFHAHAWERLIRGVHDRHAPARHPTLATVSADGWPQARTVVLRSADRVSGTLEIHTSLYSPKIADLRATPVAALHVWDDRSRLQIRIHAEVEIAQGEQVNLAWAAVPEQSRTAYSRSSIPGQLIPGALAYEPTADQSAFAVLRLRVLTMDLLHLGPRHRRAKFSREDHWVGHWVVP